MEPAWKDAVGTLDIAVRFAETDLMGVVHHGVYAVWLEAGRIAWLAAAGIPYTEIAAGGHHFAVTGLHIEYRTPARFGEVIRIETSLDALRSRQVSFFYTVRNADSASLLATATSDHVCVDEEARVARIPVHVWERIQAGAREMSRCSAPAA